MINHSACDHPSTPSARSKCRRAQASGKTHAEEEGATPKTLDFSAKQKDDSNYGQTPRDRDKQCDVCGVERIAYFGLDVISNIKLYVGEKCYYIVKRDPDGAIPLD